MSTIHTEVCPCCGNTVSAYVQVLNKSLVWACRTIIERYVWSKKPVLLKDYLNHNQLININILKNHWMIQKSDIEWARFPTQKCIDFVQEKTYIYDRVMTFNQQVIAHDHEWWDKVKKKPKLVYAYEIDEIRYKRHSDYAAEKWSTQSLFDWF